MKVLDCVDWIEWVCVMSAYAILIKEKKMLKVCLNDRNLDSYVAKNFKVSMLKVTSSCNSFAGVQSNKELCM